MTSRNALVDCFINKSGWGDALKSDLAGDASNRRYLRLKRQGTNETAVLMDAPPNRGEDIKPFIKITNHLRNTGFSAPQILSQDKQHGFLLLEDLGNNLFAPLINNSAELEYPLYCAAVDVLIQLHKFPPPNDLLNYSPKIMADYISPVFEWYQTAITGAPASGMARVTEELEAILTKYCGAPPVLALRDYHTENLIWLPKRSGIKRVGLLDYQDAVLAHPSYDLVSLLEDARRDVPENIQKKMFHRYITATNTNHAAFRIAYNAQGAQRNLRILGIFARLCLAAGKPGYIDLIPRVWAHLENNLSHPALASLKDLVFETLPKPTPNILQRLKEKCASIPMQ